MSTPSDATAAENSSSIAKSEQEPQQPTSQPQCASCKKTEPANSDPDATPTLKPCTSCKTTLYCSKDCKKADTKTHKKICASLAQKYFSENDVKMATRAPPKKSTDTGGLRKWQFDT